MTRLSRLAAWLPALAVTGWAQGTVIGRVPEVHAATLTGVPVDLPRGLQGRAGVLVLGFSQGSRDQVAAWARRLAQDYRDSHKVAYYEMAELQSVPRPLRGWVGRRIAGSVPDRAKPHFVMLNENETEWKTLSAFANSEHAYVLVIDGAGAVRYRAEGAASDAAYARLKQQLETVVDEPGPQ